MPPEVTTWTVLLGRGVTFLTVPIGRGQAYCYCDAPADGTPRPDGDVTGRLAELLTGSPRRCRPSSTMALEDGLLLAECLASGRGIAQTLATFQAPAEGHMLGS
jgi:hypothetical protein